MDKVLGCEVAGDTSAVVQPLSGEVAFVGPEVQVQRTAELLAQGAIVVNVPPLPDAMRGRLAEHVDEHIERALAEGGCPSPHVSAWSEMLADAEARLSDQLFRTRTVGAPGLVLAMGSVGDRVVTPEDSATLVRLANLAAHAPLVVLLDAMDATLDGYAPPVPITALLSPPPPPMPVPLPVPEAVKLDVTVTIPDDEPEVIEVEAHVDTHVDTIVAPVDEAPPTEPEDRPRKRRSTATVGVPVAGPSDAWRSWALALGAARGPQPLAAFEKLFVESYVPLANAIADGLDDARAVRAYDEFRRSFERAYTDAFQTFGATNRRPRLVMDAFELAAKQARLHNARSAHVLVVDSMRHDLGTHLRDALATRAAGAASLTSESTVFAALPTTTMRQLETLARGMDALRAPSPDEPAESLRGRSAETVRRLRVGSRELYKLDTVPARIGLVEEALANGEGLATGLSELAGHIADAIGRHLATLQPRTLLLVLGDHGFAIDRRGRVSCGGSSPEEVIVPALAYLVGDLH